MNLSGRTPTASIWTLDTAHFIKDVSGGCRVEVLEHHSSDQCGPVTLQLIKARHSDSFVTLSLSFSLSVHPAYSDGAKALLRGRPLGALKSGQGRPWLACTKNTAWALPGAAAQYAAWPSSQACDSGRGPIKSHTFHTEISYEPLVTWSFKHKPVSLFRQWQVGSMSPHLRDRPPWPRQRWEVSLAGSRLHPDSDWWGLESESRETTLKVREKARAQVLKRRCMLF